MFNLRIAVLLIASFSSAFAENLANISDSLAVETRVDTIKVSPSLAPETKSKPEKRDSSDHIGPTIYTLNDDEPFRPITSATYHQQLRLQPQQFQTSPPPSTFQPTTVHYVGDEAAPQGYYDRPPNADGPTITGAAKITNYGAPPNTNRGPFKGPYQLQLEQTHPQAQAQPFQLKQRYHHHEYVQASKPPPIITYDSPSPDPNLVSLQQQSPHHQRQYYTQAQEEQQQIGQQSPQQQQRHQQHSQQLQKLQPPFLSPQRQQQSQLQQLQYQEPPRQQIRYIIAIPLSYVRQLQHQLVAQHGSANPIQQQHSPAPPASLQPQRAPLPPLIVLQPVGGGSSGVNSLSREPYRQQPFIHYAPQPPAPPNVEAGAPVQASPTLSPQQLPVPLNLILAAAVRPHQPIYPAPQLLYVQPQLIRHAPEQQQPLQLQIKQQQELSHYAQAPDQQQSYTVGERNAQQPLQQQQQYQPQKFEQRPKSTVKQALSPPTSVATASASSSSSPPLLLPPQTSSTNAPLPAAPRVIFYNPTYVQAPPPEQHPLPPSHYGSYIQGQFGPVQQAATLVKLSSPSALLAPQTAPPPPFYHIHHPYNALPPLTAVLNPQSLLVAKPPLQHPQSPHQQTPPLPAFVSRPAIYMMPQNAVDGIAAQGPGGGLPYFVHPAGVHYGTHMYNPATPLAPTSNLLESVANAHGDNQQRHQYKQLQPEQHRKQQQQQQPHLATKPTSGGKDENNAIVKYP